MRGRPSHHLDFLACGRSAQVLPGPVLTHFRDPSGTFKLQPAGLALRVSADAQKKPAGKEKNELGSGGGGCRVVAFQTRQSHPRRSAGLSRTTGQGVLQALHEGPDLAANLGRELRAGLGDPRGTPWRCDARGCPGRKQLSPAQEGPSGSRGGPQRSPVYTRGSESVFRPSTRPKPPSRPRKETGYRPHSASEEG